LIRGVIGGFRISAEIKRQDGKTDYEGFHSNPLDAVGNPPDWMLRLCFPLAFPQNVSRDDPAISAKYDQRILSFHTAYLSSGRKITSVLPQPI
jgi:hypothetical protein